MKTIKILLFVLLFPLLCNGQQEEDFKTLFHKRENKEKPKIGGFAGPVMMFTAIGPDFAHMMGAGGAVMLGNTFYGGYALTKTNKITYKNSAEEELDFTYGGLLMGHIFGNNRPIHFAVSGMLGLGNLSESKTTIEDYKSFSNNLIFALTPVVEVEMNLASFVKLGIGSSISYINGPGINTSIYTSSDFFKPSVYVALKFGWFK